LAPSVKLDEHVPGQSTPEGTETIRPSPVPARTTSMVTCGPEGGGIVGAGPGEAGGASAGGPAVPWTGSGARPQASTANANAMRQVRGVMSRRGRLIHARAAARVTAPRRRDRPSRGTFGLEAERIRREGADDVCVPCRIEDDAVQHLDPRPVHVRRPHPLPRRIVPAGPRARAPPSRLRRSIPASRACSRYRCWSGTGCHERGAALRGAWQRRRSPSTAW
jgi:hypothetical protein